MRLDANKLSSAVRLALSLGVAATAGTLGTAQAQTAADNSTDQKSQSLETIVVTGSNIRRVDIETANPVVTIDKAAIQQSGKLTLGDLVQDLPAVTGPVTNPRVNNGGGTGASSISLRGLGSARTLVLVNGHRYLYGDVNAIPADAVERIEVLTDGASSVYGSDAVGGVVNFILRSNYQGAEFSADYGISDRDDGQRQGYHFVFGQTTDKGSIMAGVDYNKFDSVLAANREFSKNAIYYYYGAAHVAGGSSRTPIGYVQLPANLKAQFGCCSVGDAEDRSVRPALRSSDYRCYNAATDDYNFQAHGNVDLTPQERTNAFVVGNYKLTDNIETYLEFFHNKTQSASQLAPQPIDTHRQSAGHLGAELLQPVRRGLLPTAPTASRRVRSATAIASTTSARPTTRSPPASRARSATRSWQWNAYFNYGHFNQLNHTSGFINLAKIGAGLGPSFLNAPGNVVCGTDPARRHGRARRLHADQLLQRHRSEHGRGAEQLLRATRSRIPCLRRAFGRRRSQRQRVGPAGRHGAARRGRELSQAVRPDDSGRDRGSRHRRRLRHRHRLRVADQRRLQRQGSLRANC